ncbi:hypothetical protein FF1_041943 [Malus domestica]
MAMASPVKVVLGSIAFAVFWVLAVFPAVPFLPIGRTTGSLLGATLMIVFRVLTPDQAYAAIDLPMIGLLFLDNGFSSALFTNDTSCVVLTEFVLKVARQHNLLPHPFLLALASSANIGSAATPIGNPQNLVIAVQSKISFGTFVIGILPAMLVGVCVNALILLCMFWRLLSVQKVEEDPAQKPVAEDDVSSHRFSPATLSPSTSLNSRLETPAVKTSSNVNVSVGNVETLRNCLPSSKNEVNKVPSGAIEPARISSASKGTKQSHQKGMLIALLMDLNMSWCAITAALALVVLDFTDASPSLEKVSYSFLIFFCGMFITVSGFNKTGIPSDLWDFMEPHAQIDHASGITVLAVTILVLSNLASTVPTVLLLGGRVAASAALISAAEEKKAWLLLAWVSTVAGNLSLLGSAANLIVCEQARQSPQLAYTLSLWSHLKFGVPSTLIVTAICLTLVR